MSVIATRFLKKGKEPLLGSFGALIQCILPDEEYYPIIGSLTMVAELKNFNGFEGSLYENKNVLYGDGKLLGRKFSVLGETDFNKQDIIKISMTAIGRKEFAYNWRQHSNFFEVDIGITDEDFLKLRDNLFKEENVTTYITLIFKETGHFYESKNK